MWQFQPFFARRGLSCIVFCVLHSSSIDVHHGRWEGPFTYTLPFLASMCFCGIHRIFFWLTCIIGCLGGCCHSTRQQSTCPFSPGLRECLQVPLQLTRIFFPDTLSLACRVLLAAIHFEHGFMFPYSYAMRPCLLQAACFTCLPWFFVCHMFPAHGGHTVLLNLTNTTTRNMRVWDC